MIQIVYLINVLIIIVFLMKKNPVIHCDDIYIGNRESYMYCGKPVSDMCINDNECSS